MTIWVALLRGVNVGGKSVLPMNDLARDLEDIGCRSVKTYIQSGNAVFSMANVKPSELAGRIGKAILDRHGFQPKVQLLRARELAEAVAANPFPDAISSPTSLHLSFLARSPVASKLRSLASLKAGTESYSVVGKVFYLHAPDGIGRSKLAAGVEKVLKVDATSRNWRTVSKLLTMTREIK